MSAATLPTSLRVTFVAPFGLRHKTTVWARTLPIAQSLVAGGHHASILVPPWDSPEDANTAQAHNGVRVEQVSLRGGLIATTRRLLAALAHQQPHIVHIVKPRAHAGLVQWWLWQRRHRRSYKLVLDVDDWEQAWNPINRYGWLTSHFLTWQEEWGLRHADGITAASRWLETRANSYASAIPTLYLPNGVEPLPSDSNAPPTPPHDHPRILFFTRFVEVEPAWLREFWTALLTHIPNAVLTIAGTPVQERLAPPFHLAMAGLPQVEWLGFVQGDRLPALYARASCAIFPATPTPLLQAKCSVRLATTLLHGVPVIASAVGEQANYGANGAAHLVAPDASSTTFAEAVVDSLRSADQSAHARDAATNAMLKRYAWSRLTQPLPDFYANLLGQR